MVKKKAQQGRAKQKQKSQRGSQAGPSKAPRQNRRNYDFDDEDDNTFQPFRGFNQSQSAVPSTARAPNVSLRHQGIAFISAGANPPTINRPPEAAQTVVLEAEDDDEELDEILNTPTDDEEVDDDIDDIAIQTNIMTDEDIQIPEDGIAQMTLDSLQEETAFVVDVVGDPQLNDNPTTYNTASRRAPSPAPSDSSEEIVLFHGRNKTTNHTKVVEDPVPPNLPQQTITRSTFQEPAHVTDDLLSALTKTTSDTLVPNTSTRAQYLSGEHPQKDQWIPAPAVPYWRREKGESREELNAAKMKESGIISAKGKPDIVQSTSVASQIMWNDVLRAKNRRQKEFQELQEIEANKKPSKRRGKRGRKKDNRELVDTVFADDDPLGEEAAYEDYMENLAAQLDKDDDEDDNGDKTFSIGKTTLSRAISGPSMVVDGREYADDEVLAKHLKDKDLVGNDADEWESESDENSVLDPDSDELSSEESLDASDLEKDLEYSEQQQWDDEADLRQRRIDHMTDEHLARLFAKQQDLGYEGDELMIDDGAEMSSDGIGDVAAARKGLQGFVNFSMANTNKRGSRRSKRSNNAVQFPDASLFADTLDQYDNEGFDIMDFDRPSLRPTKKGRKGKLPPEIEVLSDEELRQTLDDAWEGDRQKKKQKKLERESLRAQGLLGSGSIRDRADLSIKYAQGMTLKQVHNELRDFLLDEDDSERVFPPMNKADRKALHEIATVLKLVSKSRGAGNNRFATLYKTKRTLAYSEDMFARISDASSRGFLTNRRPRGKRAIHDGPSRRSGVDKSSVTLRNGEIVGAGAAELGSENFGHRLMEKMGWAKGQALGKDGSGLLVPVEQRMRVGTAGLG